MTYCSTCGRAGPDEARFCPHCGAAYNRVVPGFDPAPEVAAAAMAPPREARPVGRMQEPAMVVVLSILTLGIYSLFWAWRISKEIDAFRGEPGRAHRVLRIGVILALVGFPLATGAYIYTVGSVLGDIDPEAQSAEDIDPAVFQGLEGVMLLMVVAALVGLVGSILVYVGFWRIWRGIEQVERSRGHPSPLSPGLQLFFVLMPYLSIITTFVAYYRTQKRLNELWAAPEPAAPAATAGWP